MQEKHYVVFDLETTGLDICKDEPIQLFFAEGDIETGELKDELLLHCYGEQPISREATAIHGFKIDWLKENGIKAVHAANTVINYMWKHQPLAFVGHNCMNFDFPMLQNWLRNYGSGAFRHAPCCEIYDTMHLCCVHFEQRKWMRLAIAAQSLGIEVPTDLHDARTDGALCWKIFCALKKGDT